jgi:hypothetical protein
MKNKINAVRVGSSDPNRLADLKANHESQELKDLIARGYKVKSVRKRINTVKQPRQVVVSLGDVMAATLTISWENYQKFGKGMKIVMRIY